MALQRQMHRRENKRLANAMSAADVEEILHTHTAGLVETETDMEKTIQLLQRQLKFEHLEGGVARNIYDLDLNEYGPYKMRYDRSGYWGLLAGKNGHVSIIDQHTLALKTEFFVQDSIRGACFLHSGSKMAVSQEKNVIIYDEEGVEIHRIGYTGVLQYQDTSTGNLVSQHRTKLGPCHAIRQNLFNSVLHLGHTPIQS